MHDCVCLLFMSTTLTEQWNYQKKGETEIMYIPRRQSFDLWNLKLNSVVAMCMVDKIQMRSVRQIMFINYTRLSWQ